MLPDFLVGTYRQYKQDTKTIAVWLASTARSYGYDSETLPADQDVEDVRKKSKAKSKAKHKTKKQQRDAARRLPGHRRKLVITIPEFVPLAKYITERIKAPSRVPPSVLATIKRVIKARQDCGSWYKNDSAGGGDDGHDFFVGVLMEVHEILAPYTVLPVAASDDESTLVDNLYENLTLEEPSEKFLNAPGLPRKEPEPIDRMVYEFADAFIEYLEGYVEESFAAAAFFKDVNTVYAHALQIWNQYSGGKVDLMTASITSNTAIDLIRRLEEDFFQQFPRFRRIEHHILKEFKRYDPKHKDAQQLINFMFRSKSTKRGVNLDYEGAVGADEPRPRFNIKLYEDAQYLFLDMLDIFIHYYQGSQRLSKICYKTGPTGYWNPDTNHALLSDEEKHQNNARILMELYPDLGLLGTSIITPLGEDELTKSVRNWTDSDAGPPRIHIWALAASRLFCDIHHLLGPNIWKPFDAVQRLGMDAKTTVTNCIATRDKGEGNCWPTKSDEDIKKKLTDRIDSWLVADELKTEIMHAARNVKGYKKEDHQLFRRHPMICGLFEFNIRSCLQEVGLLCLDNLDAGAMLAHLYNAVQQEGFCQAEWLDMNFFIELQTPEQLFVGGKPRNPEEYFKRIVLYQGASPEVFATNRRSPGMITSKYGPRMLKCDGELLNVLKYRWCFHNNNERATIGLDQVEKRIANQYELSRSNGCITVRPRCGADVKNRSNKNAHMDSRYSPVELLIALQFGMSRDMPRLKFDYFFLHRSCFTILHAMHGMYNPMFEKYMREGYLGNEDNLPGLVAHVMTMGVPIKQVAKLVKQKFPHFDMLPPGFKSMFDQKKILKEMGTFIQNKIENGRFRSVHNARLRQMKTEVMVYEYLEDNHKVGRVTFKKHKPTFHRSSVCTKSRCVCGTVSKQAKKKE